LNTISEPAGASKPSARLEAARQFASALRNRE
jgi:hypothetical protein